MSCVGRHGFVTPKGKLRCHVIGAGGEVVTAYINISWRCAKVGLNSHIPSTSASHVAKRESKGKPLQILQDEK